MRGLFHSAIVSVLLLAGSRVDAAPCKASPIPVVGPATANMSPDLPRDIEALVAAALADRVAPAISVAVIRGDRLVYRKAFGAARQDSRYDLASLTKVMATTPLLLRLVDRGRLKLSDSVRRFLPWLAPDKAGITLRQLLLHISGLHSVVFAGKLSDGRQTILQRVANARLRALPGRRYRYSDVGFIMLGEVAAAVGGGTLDRLVAREILAPLEMCETGFTPNRRQLKRLPTPWPEGTNHGIVYDPLAARMGGVAGHAGLYGTLDDVARYARAVLRAARGEKSDLPLSSRAVRSMLRRYPLPGGKHRGLGFNVGRDGSAWHTGYTGTSIWISPKDDVAVVLLSNRTRFKPARSVATLRRQLRQVVRAAIHRPPRVAVESGLDRLVDGDFAEIRGAKVALITNATAVDKRGRSAVALFAESRRLDLRAVFTPEHGLKARLDRHIRDGKLRIARKQVPIYSLYGKRRRPDDATLKGVDTLVYDVQPVGVRYYTYLATMGWAMEEAAKRKLRFVVLDRPNPLGGLRVEGPLSSPTRRTSTAYHPIPVRHGLTIGELAQLYNRERRIGAQLVVVPLRHWQRKQTFAEQGRRWINPSPNIRSARQALAYAAVGLLESTNLSVGRGTHSPFLQFGAPWIASRAFARVLNQHKLPGVQFVPVRFKPRSSRYKRKRCEGVRLLITDARRFQPVRTGLTIAVSLRAQYREWDSSQFYRLINHPPSVLALHAGRDAKSITRLWRAEEARFRRLRKRYMRY